MRKLSIDIVPNHRLVSAYVMAIGGRNLSPSLATVSLAAVNGGTRLTFTWQSAFFGVVDMLVLREQGWCSLLASLDRELQKTT